MSENERSLPWVFGIGTAATQNVFLCFFLFLGCVCTCQSVCIRLTPVALFVLFFRLF